MVAAERLTMEQVPRQLEKAATEDRGLDRHKLILAVLGGLLQLVAYRAVVVPVSRATETMRLVMLAARAASAAAAVGATVAMAPVARAETALSTFTTDA